MSRTSNAIGIKQVIRYEWMIKTTHLLLSGLDEKSIRKELHRYLAERRGNGSFRKRSGQTRAFAVTNLMSIWITPNTDIIPFRDRAIVLQQEYPGYEKAIHWAMFSAAYPFWLSVSRQVGRLLALQDQITTKQITTRLKEHYGDRQTVSRYALYVIRSLAAWGLLKESKTAGCYEKPSSMRIENCDVSVLLIESVLRAAQDSRASLEMILYDPALYPFRGIHITVDDITRYSSAIIVNRSSLHDHVLSCAKV